MLSARNPSCRPLEPADGGRDIRADGPRFERPGRRDERTARLGRLPSLHGRLEGLDVPVDGLSQLIRVAGGAEREEGLPQLGAVEPRDSGGGLLQVVLLEGSPHDRERADGTLDRGAEGQVQLRGKVDRRVRGENGNG